MLNVVNKGRYLGYIIMNDLSDDYDMQPAQAYFTFVQMMLEELCRAFFTLLYTAQLWCFENLAQALKMDKYKSHVCD